MINIGDRVIAKEIPGAIGVTTNRHPYLDFYINVFFDDPIMKYGITHKSYYFRDDKLEVIEKRKEKDRVLNLDLDPYGEENW